MNRGLETQVGIAHLVAMPHSLAIFGPSAAFIVALALAGCVTTATATPKPEFSQRAAPRPGQDEIELTAALGGRLAIEDGCLGLVAGIGKGDVFTTIVWPLNARLEAAGNSWRVVNSQTGRAIALGEGLRGGGGFRTITDPTELREYNRYLTRDLSARCAAKGSFALNREFAPG